MFVKLRTLIKYWLYLREGKNSFGQLFLTKFVAASSQDKNNNKLTDIFYSNMSNVFWLLIQIFPLHLFLVFCLSVCLSVCFCVCLSHFSSSASAFRTALTYVVFATETQNNNFSFFLYSILYVFSKTVLHLYLKNGDWWTLH